MKTKITFAIRGFAVAIAVAIGAEAASAAIDGDALNRLCSDVDRITDIARCQGYVEAIIDLMRGGSSAAGYRACIGAATADHQLLAAVEDFLDDATDEGAEPAAGLVAKALAQAFPCRGGAR